MGATGCSTADANRIEDVMRNEIFHSTLDWQKREDLEEAARLAVTVLQQMDRDSVEEAVPLRDASGRQRNRVEIKMRLPRAGGLTLASDFLMIPESVPGLRGCRLEWVFPSSYYLILSGSRRAVTRAARMVGLADEEIHQALQERIT
jgi:hypothetical protein